MKCCLTCGFGPRVIPRRFCSFLAILTTPGICTEMATGSLSYLAVRALGISSVLPGDFDQSALGKAAQFRKMLCNFKIAVFFYSLPLDELSRDLNSFGVNPSSDLNARLKLDSDAKPASMAIVRISVPASLGSRRRFLA